MSRKKRHKGKRSATLKHKKQISPGASETDLNLLFQTALKHHQSGKLEKAERIYRRIVKSNPCHADALHLLGVIDNQTGKNEVAVSLIQKAIQHNPDSPIYYYNLAKALKACGHLDTALSCYQKALELKPDDAEVYFAMGNTHTSKRELDDAIVCYQQAVELKPNYIDAFNNMGTAYKDQGKLDDAISAYHKALQLKPDDYEVYNNLGIAFKNQGKFNDAIECYEKAIQLKPDYADVYNNIGIAFKDQGQLSDAITCYQKSLVLKPDMFETHNNLGVALKDQGRLDEAVLCYHRALELNPDYVSAHSNLLYGLHHLAEIDPVQLFDQHELWAKKHAELLATGIPPHQNDMKPDRRLRIGYVSPDFRTHSVAYFMEALLENHDHSAFEIFCYSDVAVKDTTSVRFENLADCWQDIAAMSDENVARRVRLDGIDILVDLAGHTAKNRMLLFARKPAPIQVTYLGYPNTTGLDTIDYRITDTWSDPSDQTDHLYTEKLVRLPHGFLCYTPDKTSPAVGSLPAEEFGSITFGSFNSRAKITPEVIKLWSMILVSVPHSRLYMKSKSLSDSTTQDSLRDDFIENDVSPEQIKFMGYSASTYDHLDLYNSVDIGLDTFPYNGTTTTCEAMWMGVPVIVLSGLIHMSRVGVSLLSNIGLADLIGNSADDYVYKAVELAANLEKLKKIRLELRNMMCRSPLMNGALFTHSLETAYQRMWEQWGNKVLT